ncbi:ATP-binding protein [Nocardioides bruguierae]|uniref:histidine kinase n=1 Tax=Nocardioides bruguierae TaxID=2945102 RepID=A0A9X2D4D7_9ACTN|nr:ATP-binding protein [Nocardioides bruguierae]MCM0619167.1 PAS domain-containing sensor histidine kinase [Nocardioides bruguierae]
MPGTWAPAGAHGDGARPPGPLHRVPEPEPDDRLPAPSDTASFWRMLAQATPDALCVLDRDGRVAELNDLALAILGCAAEDVVGTALSPLLDPPLGLPSDPVPTVRPDGEAREAVLRRPGGEERHVRVVLSEPPSGLAPGVVLVGLRDVTEERVLHDRADRLRDDLVATVSHELRTPLTSIIGYVELLRDVESERLGARAASMLEVIARNAQRELRLVNDLLDLTSLQAGVSSAAMRHVPVADLVRRCAEGLRIAVRQHGLRLLVEIEDEAVVRGDAQRLEQVLDNLVTNAVKFTPPGGTVRVVARVEQDEAVLLVADTGEGIAAHDLPRVCDRLYRGENAVRSAAQGAGLGLSIARAVVSTHGGRLEIDSEVGAGTCVTVRLPLDEAR